MQVIYQGLKIRLPIDGIIQVEDLTLEASFNRHATVCMLLLMEEEGIERSIQELEDGAGVEIDEGEALFKGRISLAEMVPVKGLYYLKITAVSYTSEWGLAPVSQSYLNLDATYEQVMRKVLHDYPKADIKDCVTGGRTIPDFLLQYEETDWDFLIRLASHFQSFLVPDYKEGYGRAYFGIPDLGPETVLSEEDYITVKDLGHYMQANLDGQLLQQEAIRWNVRTYHAFTLAQKVVFRGVSTIVTKVRYQVVDGELCHFYELSRRKGYLSVPIRNKNIFGMSIPATVKERSGNCVRVHFHIDKEYDCSPNVRYFTYAIESSFIYCMPEVGSQVHIYFPSEEESDAIAVHAIRMEQGGQTGKSQGRGYAQNPDYKSFSNVNCAEFLMTPTSASAAAEEEKDTCVYLDTEGNVSVKGKNVEIHASTDLFIGSALEEDGAATKEISLKGETVTIQAGRGGKPQVELTAKAHIIAAFVKLDAQATTQSNPSVSELEKMFTAGDQDLRSEVNADTSQRIVDKYEEGRRKIISGAADALVAVITVAVAVTAAPFTGGLSLGAFAAMSTLGAGVAVAGYADFQEGIEDIKKSGSGDLTESYNFVRDTAFSIFGENKQTAYELAKLITSIAFGAVSGNAFGNMGKSFAVKKGIDITCASQKLRNLKTAIQVGSGIKNAIISDLANTGKISFKNVITDAAIGFGQGQLGSRLTDGIFNWTGAGNWGNIASKAMKATIGSGVDFGLDASVSALLNREFDPVRSAVSSVFSNVLAVSIADPVDAASGFYMIHATDFILASLPSALKLERTYFSVGREMSLFGYGWSFPLGSQIYCDAREHARIHMTAITGHSLMFEKEEGEWVNKLKGCERFFMEEDPMAGRFLLTDVADHTVCVYGFDGRLQKVEYPNRQFLTFSYDHGQLSRITTPLGNHLDIVCRDGKILQITDEIGRRLQYRYEGDFLTEVVHTDEGITHYEYDSEGHVLSATNENGTRYVENEYDGKGRVVRQTLPDGTTQRFEYDDRNRRNTILFGDKGRKEVYEYNDQLLVTRITYGDGTSVSYEYSDQNHRVAETSRNGSRTFREYDSYGRLTCEAKPDGYKLYQEYDESHDLVRAWDTDGRETVNTYDNSHNLLISREKIGEDRWKETRYQYDEKGRCVSTRDALGNETVRQFDPNRAYPSMVTTPEGEETAYEYDQVGRRMAVSNTYGNVHLSYNSRNFVTKRTDGEGNVSRWFYDRMGKLVSYYPAGYWEEKKEGYEFLYNLQERRVDTVSPMKNHNRLFRDFDGNITREIHPVSYQEKGEDGEGTRYEYDWYGNQIRIFYADGGCERRFYDPDGNLIKQVMPEAYDPETDDGAGYIYSYDPMGRLSRVEDPDGNLAHSYRYNGHGQTVWEADGEGTEHFYEYNGLGLKSRERVRIRKEKDVVFYRVTAYEYDLQGNKIEETYGQEEVAGDKDPETWHRIGFAYDRDNRLVKVWDGFGAEARYAYDCLGNLVMEEQVIEEGIRRHIRYSYNKNGWRVRKEERIQGNGKEVTSAVTCYGYDKAGNLTKITTPNGYEIRGAYDGDGRLTEERIIDRPNGIDRRESYTYDAAGNLLSETLEGREGEVIRREYGYDLKDRKIQEQNPQGGIARYLYDRNGLLIKEINPYGYGMDGGKEPGTTYRYDSRGNQIQETNSLGEVVKEKRYNVANQLVAEIDGMGNETEFTYLPDGQTRSVSRENGGQKRQLQNYKYNARGQIIGITDGIGETVNYDVDGWGRITRIRFSDDVSEGYEYTPSGQVSRAIDGNGNSVRYQYNSLGKVRKRTDQLGYVEEFQYDEEGNIRLYVDRNGNRVYRIYNVFGNLVYEKAEDQEGKGPVIITFRYDSLGRIRQAVCDGHSYEYIYNDQGLLNRETFQWKMPDLL